MRRPQNAAGTTPVRLCAPQVADAIREARATWLAWADVFGHAGAVAENPLLTSRYHLGCFAWEYNPGRTLPLANLPHLQAALRDDAALHAALEAGDAAALEHLANGYSEAFSGRRTAGGLRAFLTRLAAWCNPSAFIALDRHSLRGLALLAGNGRGMQDRAKAALGIARDEARWPDGTLQQMALTAEAIDAERFAFRMRVLECACTALGKPQAVPHKPVEAQAP